MTVFLCARHGETEWNRLGRLQGTTDVALNDRGREQAQGLRDILAAEDLTAVYASSLSRALETARIAVLGRGLAVHIEPDLREKHYGTWEGLHDEEIVARHNPPPGAPWGDGETGEAVAARALAVLRRLRAKHPSGTVLIVTHEAVLSRLVAHVGGELGIPTANGTVRRFACEDGDPAAPLNLSLLS